jgi:hypothetical protein
MFEENRFEGVLKSLRVRRGKVWTQAKTAQLLEVSFLALKLSLDDQFRTYHCPSFKPLFCKSSRQTYFPQTRELPMKYQVAYRLKHPEYVPTTSRTVIDACSHAELETRLGKIKAKWQARGYTVHITRVSQIDVGKTAFHT